jgi:hypothetical protein
MLARIGAEGAEHLNADDAAVRGAPNHGHVSLIIDIASHARPESGLRRRRRIQGQPSCLGLGVHDAVIVSNICSIVKALLMAA